MYRIKNEDYKGIVEKDGIKLKDIIIVFDGNISNDRLEFLDDVKQVIGYEFKGNHIDLANVNKPKKPLRVFLDQVDMLGVDIILNRFPSWVNIVLRTDKAHMYDVYQVCQKYENVRFCGGYLFQLDGCRLGCGYKDTKSSIFEGCSCGVTDLELDGVIFKDFKVSRNKTQEVRSILNKENKKPTKKERKNVISLLIDGEGASF